MNAEEILHAAQGSVQGMIIRSLLAMIPEGEDENAPVAPGMKLKDARRLFKEKVERLGS